MRKCVFVTRNSDHPVMTYTMCTIKNQMPAENYRQVTIVMDDEP